MTKNHLTSKLNPSKWGSNWTVEKLDAFKKYVEAYLTIMDVYKNKYGWKTLYFDGFAGSGDCNRDNDSKEPIDNSLFFDFGIEEAEIKIYKGAAERVLSLKKKFDYYYFIDLNVESLKKLKEKLSPFEIDYCLQFREGDANKYVKELSAAPKYMTKKQTHPLRIFFAG